jgi:putative tryptophan/tyrosine transport system substrate-binding protein
MWWPSGRLACVIAVALLSSSAWAQGQAPVRRIGFLGIDSQMQGFRVDAFRERMRALGYVEGRNLVIEIRWAEGRFDRLPELAAELAAQNLEVLVTAAPPAVRALQKSTSRIPIVIISHDPIGMGFVSQLARPGGNITGIAFQDSTLSTKRVDLLKSVLPRLSRLAIVWNEAGGGADAVKATEAAAAKLGLQTRAFEVRAPPDLARAVADAAAWGAQGVIQLASPLITLHRRLLLDALAAHAMPASCEMRLYVEDGCLMTYSADFSAMFRDMADFTVRLLAGANAAELPMQQPRQFDFLVNITTAKKLGLAIPASVLLEMTAGIR